jgi:primosomal protein N' (replication factor Y)
MIARVAFPIAIPGMYDYTIPQHLTQMVIPGVPVKVELRNRTLWGVVVELSPTSSVSVLKEILETKSGQWAESSSALIRLYQWIASYYQTDIAKVFKPYIRKKVVELSPKTVVLYCYSGMIPTSLLPKQLAVAKALTAETEYCTTGLLMSRYGITASMVTTLYKAGVLKKTDQQVLREAIEVYQERGTDTIELTEEQKEAVEYIWTRYGAGQKPFLLYGITGSGKTHLYIELAKRILAEGKTILILVPEISLTPQTIKRFRDGLTFEIAVIHSRMSEGERRDSIEEIVAGRKRIVIGVRSAVLVPMTNVGLIIVDEEHDGSYKQSETDPRYNARDVAVMRGFFQKALVVLGSATPSFESYHNAKTGKYFLVTLSRRFGIAALPGVTVIDMAQEHRENNWTVLSRYLRGKIVETIGQQRQIILLLNRRGFSVSLICKDCGHIYSCPNCSVNLIYHRSGAELRCHQCGFNERAPERCRACNGQQIQYKGTGIQKVEEYLHEVFPTARILRMDQDTTRKKGAHLTLLDAFAQKKADILLGTQMVAKGLNFPGVRLVGVLQADIGLHFPDFRASERTFQLLSQVAGRAGRSDNLGEVVIQTYVPEDPGVIAAQKHDFTGFFQQEIQDRKSLAYPPFTRLVRLLVQGPQEDLVKETIMQITNNARSIAPSTITILGPTPAILSRINNSFRYAILFKSYSPKSIQYLLAQIRKGFVRLPRELKVIIDVDPVNMM